MVHGPCSTKHCPSSPRSPRSSLLAVPPIFLGPSLSFHSTNISQTPLSVSLFFISFLVFLSLLLYLFLSPFPSLFLPLSISLPFSSLPGKFTNKLQASTAFEIKNEIYSAFRKIKDEKESHLRVIQSSLVSKNVMKNQLLVHV